MRYLFLLLVLLAGCRIAVPTSFEEISESELMLLHNKERGLLNKKYIQLESDDHLNKIAQQWAENMARRNSMYHSVLKFDNKGTYTLLGENIAKGQRDVDEVMKTWMNSRGHREKILNRNFNRIGVGYAYSDSGVLYWCVQFGASQKH